jgi:flagellar biosynthetic protein FliR
MTDWMTVSIDELTRVLVIFIRISVVLALAPIFNYRSIPMVSRLGLALIIAFLLSGIVDAPSLTGMSTGEIFRIAVTEVFAGALFGFTIHLLFTGVQVAGEISGMMMGFAIVNVLDPQSQSQTSIVSQFKYIFALLIFLTINGHHFIIQGMMDSFRILPVGAASMTPEAMRILLEKSSDIFTVAVKIAAPPMISLLIMDIALGIIAKTVPQMNIFIVGFPLKIGLGMISLGFSLPFIVVMFKRLWTSTMVDGIALLKAMGV